MGLDTRVVTMVGIKTNKHILEKYYTRDYFDYFEAHRCDFWYSSDKDDSLFCGVRLSELDPDMGYDEIINNVDLSQHIEIVKEELNLLLKENTDVEIKLYSFIYYC